MSADGQFSSREEVDAYFSGHLIECLVCGKEFKGLGPHLWGAHAMTAREYKRKYGLPYKRGLSCASTFIKRSSSASEIYERQGFVPSFLAVQGTKGGNKGKSLPPAWALKEFQEGRFRNDLLPWPIRIRRMMKWLRDVLTPEELAMLEKAEVRARKQQSRRS